MIATGACMSYFYQPDYSRNDFSGYHELDAGKKKNLSLMTRYEKENVAFDLVIYQTGCSDCHKAQKELNTAVKMKRLHGRVIVLDVNDFTKKELTSFKYTHPALLVQKRWINSPTVAKMKGNKVLHAVTNGDEKRMLALLK